MKERARYQRDKAKVSVRTRAWKLKRDFGLTVEQYDEMFAQQRGVCAVCKKTQKKRLSVDHCHNSKKVRGLLCQPCNMAIGLLKDDWTVAHSLYEYLRNNQ